MWPKKKQKTKNSDSNLKYSVIKGLLNKLCQSTIIEYYATISTSQITLVVKNPPANVGHIRDTSLILGSGRFPGGGHGNPLQRMPWTERGAW